MAKPVQTIAQKLFTTASQHCAHVLERWEIFSPPNGYPNRNRVHGLNLWRLKNIFLVQHSDRKR